MNPSVEPNEDPEFDPEELVDASQTLPRDSVPPELDPATDQLAEWDASPASFGHATPKVLPEDEVSADEELVGEGMDEADREQRIAAADPDFEP